MKVEPGNEPQFTISSRHLNQPAVSLELRFLKSTEQKPISINWIHCHPLQQNLQIQLKHIKFQLSFEKFSHPEREQI